MKKSLCLSAVLMLLMVPCAVHSQQPIRINERTGNH